MAYKTRTPYKGIIFDKLIERNICFAVCVAQMRAKAFTNLSVEYFIVIKDDDLDKVGDIYFKDCMERDENGEKYNLHEKVLTEKDINIFKQKYMNLFKKVVHNSDGRVYELKDNPFKPYYHKK